MTPEAESYLAKARTSVGKARNALDVPVLVEVAARLAYRAGSHSAQALIFERTGGAAKTHRGVRSLFARLSEDDLRLDRAFSSFLGRGHHFQQVVDHGVGPRAAL